MPPLAVFTVVQNEQLFLPAWLRHYTRHVPADDIYVLDHNTTGDAADVLVDACQTHGVRNILPVHHELSFDSDWLMRLTRWYQSFLLASYDTVVFTCADELLVPREGKLQDFAIRHVAEARRSEKLLHAPLATGYEVVHNRDREPALDPAQPWLAQRQFCYPCRRYSKPLLAPYSLWWFPGWAAAANVPTTQQPTPELLLWHLHRIDYDHCLRSHREKAARRWKPEERNDGPFRHNLVDDPELLSRWILCNSDKQDTYAVLECIPPEFKELI